VANERFGVVAGVRSLLWNVLKCKENRGSSASLGNSSTSWTTGVQFPARAMMGFFHLATASRRALGPTQPPFRWVAGALTRGIKRSRRQADHLPPSSVEVNAWSYTSTRPIRLNGVVIN